MRPYPILRTGPFSIDRNQLEITFREKGQVCKVSLEPVQKRLILELIDAADNGVPITNQAPNVYHIRQTLRNHLHLPWVDGLADSPEVRAAAAEVIKTDQGRYFWLLPVTQAPIKDPRDRLFTSWANRLMSLPKAGGPIPWIPRLDPVVLAFASRPAYMSAKGVRVLPPPGEEPSEEGGPWWKMKDELTGDAVPVHGMAVEMAERGLQSLPKPSGHLDSHFMKTGGRPDGTPPAILFLGSAYANKFLARMLDDERAAYPAAYPFGAWFDVASPVVRRTARVEFFRQDGRIQQWDLPLTQHPELEYAVVRRWRTKYGNDAMMFAGTMSQGTAAATAFMRNSECVGKKLIPALSVQDQAWEWVAFDVILEVPILQDEFFDVEEIKVVAAEARAMPPLPAVR